MIFLALLVVASLSTFPVRTLGQTSDIEQPKALPLTVGNIPLVGGTQHIGAAGEVWQEDDREVLIRNERGAKNKGGNEGGNSPGGGKKGKNKKVVITKNTNTSTNVDTKSPNSCRYVKSAWTECDAKTNTRSRTLNLKKGEPGCVPTRTIQKKCKKACRYEKGVWAECINGQMTRSDKLKSTSDSSCQPTREVNKNCNPAKSNKSEKKERQGKGSKDKGGRKSRA